MKRIAMWSGPRNISTAMMRSWGNRADTVVWDEPLYSHYLLTTQIRHPGAEEVVQHHESDWRKVVQMLTQPLPDGKTIQYEKQMAHHLLPDIDLGWLDARTNCLLIRDPARVLVSLSEFLPLPTVEETGLPQQLRIYQYILDRTGDPPPIVDSADILDSPGRMLNGLCERLGVDFDAEMLRWPPGPRETDGIWAKHWYAKVYDTTEFQASHPRTTSVPQHLAMRSFAPERWASWLRSSTWMAGRSGRAAREHGLAN